MDPAGLTIWTIAILIVAVIALSIGRKKNKPPGSSDRSNKQGS
jgi:hypothetical protein